MSELKSYTKQIYTVGNEDFRKQQNYFEYSMFFLQVPMPYQFNDPVDLKKSRFSFNITKLGIADLNTLNSIFVQFDPDMKIFESSFINAKDTIFLDEKGEPTDFIQTKKWRLAVTIQGYKKSATGKMTPIWKINEAICL